VKWVGQHIWNLIARFRSDVYLENINTGTIVSGGNLGLDSNNKIVKSTITTSSGDITGVDLTGGTGISVDNELNTTGGDYSATLNILGARPTALGGVKIFSSIAETATQTPTTTSGRYYVIQRISSGDHQDKLVVNVPWVDTDTNTQLTNDQVKTAVEEADDSNVFTNADHTKLNGIEAGATADQTASEIRTLLGTGNGNLLPAAGENGQFLKHDGTFGTPNYTTNTDTQLTNEQVQDIVGAMFTDNTETNITATYQDEDGTIDLVSTNTQLTNEQVQDIVGAMFTGNTETNITATYQDEDGTIDLVSTDTNTQLSNEQVQDIVGAMFTGNTETNVTATYQDSDGTIDLVAASSSTTESFVIACSDETSNLTTGTKVTFRMPYAFTITAVKASLTTAASGDEAGGKTNIEITNNGSSIFSGDIKLHIETEETTSEEAASQATLNEDTTGCSNDAEIKITINNVLSTPGAGLKVAIIGNQ
tara:strand:- start:4016 stop:5452 length:1437 start_codon:yes stop_codon:yes gene_type:complete